MKTFPTLYKKDNNTKIQQWTISVDGTTITTTYGQLGGKLQTTQDVVKEGKNDGKVNATTAEEQALKETEAKWLKQKKKNYVESLQDASEGKADTSVVQGGIPPMLSINKSHPKDPIIDKYLKFPCIVQPKLDGACCIAIVEDGVATLWSRTQKPIHCAPHIVEELEFRFPEGKVILHGELYNHEYADRFQDLMSIVRKDEPDEEGLYKVLQLHVYDMPECNIGNIQVNAKTSYGERYDAYSCLLAGHFDSILDVEAFYCKTKEEVLSAYESYLKSSYEGAMAKNLKAPYESGKRSYNILKMKEFLDGEGVIVSVEEGRGKDAGVASKFWCRYPVDNGKRFKVRLKCTQKEKREYYLKKEELVGKQITYTYKRLTDEGMPYIPVGKAIRDYE